MLYLFLSVCASVCACMWVPIWVCAHELGYPRRPEASNLLVVVRCLSRNWTQVFWSTVCILICWAISPVLSLYFQPYLLHYNYRLSSNYSSLCLKIATWFGSFWNSTVNVLFLSIISLKVNVTPGCLYIVPVLP